MLIGADVPYNVTCGLSAPPLKFGFTMLLINGAFVLLKICLGAERSETGCVQLWFSIAITKTVLIESAFAAPEQIAKLEATMARTCGHTRVKREENKEYLFRRFPERSSPGPTQTND